MLGLGAENQEMNPLKAPASQPDQTPSSQPTHGLAQGGIPTCVRQLQVDVSTTFDMHWVGGRAFDSQLFNAMSFAFPVGEQYFIDSVRAGVAALPFSEQQAWQPTLRSFVGQEAVHRHVHGKFNSVLAGHGLRNTWGPRVQHRAHMRNQGAGAGAGAWPARQHVAATAAYEHLTAVLAQNLLNNPHWLAGAPERLQAVWHWHAVEEVEHRAVAFDLMLALGVPWHGRALAFVVSLWEFNADFAQQLFTNLRHSKALWRWRTWADAARLMLGKGGIARTSALPILAYLLPGFHPAKHTPSVAVAAWLDEHRESYAVVGQAQRLQPAQLAQQLLQQTAAKPVTSSVSTAPAAAPNKSAEHVA